MWEPFLMTPTSTRRKIGLGIIYIVDVVIFIAALTWIGLVEFGITPHFKQGFHCNDQSINYEFRGDTVTVSCLVLSCLVPIVFMWIIECINVHQKTPTNSSNNNNSIRIIMKSGITKCSGYIKSYIIGITSKLFIVETLKSILGELRPHFLHTCNPDALKACKDGLTLYIEEYECTGYSEFGNLIVTDSSKSFPSGHASISVFQAIFMIWYFQEKFPKTRSYSLLPLIQCLYFCWACFCSVSRITDHRHHWWDVLAGTIFGVVFATFTCSVFCKRFKDTNNIKTIPVEILPNQNGSTANNHYIHHHQNHQRHTSIKRLISDTSIKEEVTLNSVTVT